MRIALVAELLAEVHELVNVQPTRLFAVLWQAIVPRLEHIAVLLFAHILEPQGDYVPR